MIYFKIGARGGTGGHMLLLRQAYLLPSSESKFDVVGKNISTFEFRPNRIGANFISLYVGLTKPILSDMSKFLIEFCFLQVDFR